MDINVSALDYLLKKKYQIIKKGPFNADSQIHSIRLVSDNIEACEQKKKKDELYITRSPLDGTSLCITENASPDKDGWYLVCDKGAVDIAVSDVFETCMKCSEWYSQTVYDCELSHDYRAASENFESTFNGSVLLMDSLWRILYVGDPMLKIWSGLSDINILDDSGDLLQALYDMDPDFDSTITSREFTIVNRFNVPGQWMIGRNLFDADEYIGRLVLALPEGDDEKGVRWIAEHYIKEIEICLAALKKNSSGSSAKELIRKNLKQLLDNTAGMSETTAVFKDLGILNHTFQIISLISAGYIQTDKSLEHMAMALEGMIYDSAAVVHNKQIVCLCWANGESNFGRHPGLATFMREHLFKAGISQPFRDAFLALKYYRQSLDVIEVGQKKDPSYWRFDFSDYTGDVVLSECARAYSKEDLCPSFVRKLISYDMNDPGLDLTETLHAFIKAKCNGSQAAELLHIHRTTFFYRLKKMHEVCSIDFDNWDTIFDLMLYFSL